MKLEVKVCRSLDTSLAVQTICFLTKHFSRRELRLWALRFGVKRGQNKIDTIHNLIESGCVNTIFYTLPK